MREEIDYRNLFKSRFSHKVDHIKRIGGGHNSKVFRVKCTDGSLFAAKVYHRHPLDKRDRLATEFKALSFLFQNNITNVPKPIFADGESGFAIYEFISGEKLIDTTISEHDINDSVTFLKQLDSIKKVQGSNKLPVASEACFSFSEIIENINRRLSQLQIIDKSEPVAKALDDFLRNNLEPSFERAQKKLYDNIDHSLETEIDLKERALSPSDFGFHNALRKSSGRITYLDFEYFGWDDPAKMIADFLLHPGMNLTDNLKLRFAEGILRHFDHMKKLVNRFELIYPFFAIKWSVILLNEFTRLNLERRKFAEAEEIDITAMRKSQLNKAKLMLKEVRRNHVWSENFH